MTPSQNTPVVEADREAEKLQTSHRYAAFLMAELADAKREISLLRDAVVTYGDRQRMGTVHDMALQQAIDRAFDREA